MLNNNNEQLFNILESMSAESITQKQTNILVENSFKIALSYLRMIHGRMQRIFIAEDSNMQDFAIDAIANLFSCNDNGSLITFKEVYDNWLPKVKDENGASYFINKVIASVVEQFVIQKLKILDIPFAKNMDSVRYLIRKENCSKVKFLGVTYIVRAGIKEVTGDVITYDVFEEIPSEYITNKNEYLMDLLDFIENELNYFPAIPLNRLVFRIKNLDLNSFKVIKDYSDSSQDFENNELLKIGLERADTVLMNYYIKGKINKDEKNSFQKALLDLALDLGNGRIYNGSFSYVEYYIPGLTREVYTSKYNHMFEYLIKVMKNTIGEQIREKVN